MTPPRRFPTDPEQVWPVCELAREFSARLEQDWPPVWVRGEVSGLKLHAASGHRYFTLKDAQAQFAAVLWRGRAVLSDVLPRDGMSVEVLAQLVYYGPGGRLQLDVQRLRAAGGGDLMRAYLELKERLAGEGLFDAGRKRSIPPYPDRIGLLTSESGAALQDMLKVLSRRRPSLKLYLLPVPVQGPSAGPALAQGLERLASWPGLDLDLIILGRGGGSFEDLFCFNHEDLVRAISSCRIPVISAVGHEIDTTLSDLAADLRAPTPSAAAELAVPETAQLAQNLELCRARLRGAMLRRVAEDVKRLEALRTHRSLAEPLRRLRDARQRMDELRDNLGIVLARRSRESQRRSLDNRRRLRAALERLQAEASARLLDWPRRLETLVRRALRTRRQNLEQDRHRLQQVLKSGLDQRTLRLEGLARRLDGREAGRLVRIAQRLGLVRVLSAEGRDLDSVRLLEPDMSVRLQFHDGAAGARITTTQKE